MSDSRENLGELDGEYRGRYLRFLATVSLVVALVLIPLLLAWDMSGAATACAIYSPVCIWVAWATQRKIGSPDVLGNVYILATLLVTLGGIYFQDRDAVIDPWILCCPVAAFAICKRQVAALWTWCTLLSLAVVNQVAPHPSSFASATLLALAVAAISTVLYVFSAHVERNEQLIVKLGNTDSLTGVLNRRSFVEVLQAESRRNFRRHSTMTVYMIDVDYFKRYNDHYGHVLGDDVLVRVAAALKQTAQRADDFVFRYGGEEFCVLCSDLDMEQAMAFAEQLRACIETLALAHQASPLGRVSVSVGCRHADAYEALTPHTLVEEADKALYQAKAKGRNRTECYPQSSAGCTPTEPVHL